MDTRTAIEMLQAAQLRIDRDALVRGLENLTLQLDRLERYAQGRVHRCRPDEPLRTRVTVCGRSCSPKAE
jgi:hypothetical protein